MRAIKWRAQNLPLQIRSLCCCKSTGPLEPLGVERNGRTKNKLEKSHFLLFLFATTTNLKHIVQELFMKTSWNHIRNDDLHMSAPSNINVIIYIATYLNINDRTSSQKRKNGFNKVCSLIFLYILQICLNASSEPDCLCDSRGRQGY